MNDKIVGIVDGGAVAEFVKKYRGETIRCFGTCRGDWVIDAFRAYPHDGGLADGNGKRWWVYFKCPECGYGHSFAKMPFFMKKTEQEHEEEKKWSDE